MFDVLYLGAFILLALVLAFDSFNKWRSSKKILYLIAIGSFLGAAISVFSSMLDTIYLIIGGLILRLVAQNSKKKNVDEVQTGESDEGNVE